MTCLVVSLAGCRGIQSENREGVNGKAAASNEVVEATTTVILPEPVLTLPEAVSAQKTERSISTLDEDKSTLAARPETETVEVLTGETQVLQENQPELSGDSMQKLMLSEVESLATLFPIDDIQIIQPGDDSMVVSPFEVGVILKDDIEAPYWVELLGQDGRLLYRQVWAVPESSKKPKQNPANLFFHFAVDFGIPADAKNPSEEKARLVITRLDSYGRIQAVNSVDMVLKSAGFAGDEQGESSLTVGETGYFHEPDIYTEIFIQDPAPGVKTSGGEVLISGLKRTLPNPDAKTNGQLFILLVAQDGRVVGQRVAAVLASDDGKYGQFTTSVPYRVSTSTPVRLVVYEDGSPVSPYTHLSSLELQLEP